MKSLPAIGALLLFASSAMAQVSAGAAWVREPNPARDLTAAFMTLTNHGTTPVALTRVSSLSAKVVEMHEMKMVDGMMSMRMIEAITIPPGATVKLEPGGLHLMLISLTETLTEGSRVLMTLELDDGTSARIEAGVRKAASAHDHHAH